MIESNDELLEDPMSRNRRNVLGSVPAALFGLKQLNLHAQPQVMSAQSAPGVISSQATEQRAFLAALAAKLRSEPGMPLSRVREIYEHWGDLASEPADVDYEVIRIGAMMALLARPKGASAKRVFLCTHGGGYRVCSPYSHRKMYGHLAKQAGAQALIVDYRRVPEATFPSAVVDCAAGYRYLLQQGVLPSGIIVAGDSAGGNLAVTTVLAARSRDLPLPAGIIAMSAAIDPYATGMSYEANASTDVLLSRAVMQNVGKGYLASAEDAANPLATPLNSDLRGMPPLYIQVGGSEVLLDDSLRLADAARAAGMSVAIDVFPQMQHVFQLAVGFVPEATQAILQQAAWANRTWQR